MRTIVVWLARLLLRIFFRQIDVLGEEKVPDGKPVIFAMNHPSALIDPMFILALSGRRVCFLAKEPLFRMPVVGLLVRAAGCLPVYRAQDAADPAKNKATFERARAIVSSGGAIAIFPEGTSHDDPKLRALKTGLARIAIGAAAAGATNIQVVPAGLYYSNKRRFRSEALLCYGEPISVPSDVTEEGEPSPDAVRDLTAEVARGVELVTLQAERRSTIDALAWAERLFTAEGGEDSHSLAVHFATRRRFLEVYAALRETRPRDLLDTAEQIISYDRRLAQLGLSEQDLPRAPLTAPIVAFEILCGALWLAFTPLALVGAILHYPAYQLVRAIASRMAGDGVDVVATIKVLASMALYPLSWLVAAVGATLRFGVTVGACVLALAPVSAWLALVLRERWRRLRTGVQILMLYSLRRPEYDEVIAERRAIRDAIAKLAEPSA